MNPALESMLSRYHCRTADDYKNALKEIMQEIALLGLWRSKFYEHAAFYGGTALRVLYGLDRFSEDLDFSLLEPDPGFSIDKYLGTIKDELLSFGFEVSVKKKEKNETRKSAIQSAFIKAGTYQSIISIEVDIDPPGGFATEIKILLQPIPFNINTFTLPDLFAGKLHSVLCRKWKNRVKGRDWYDLVWYVGRQTELNLLHLEQRMIQSGHWERSRKMALADLHVLLEKRINEVDFNQAGSDVVPFLRDPDSTALWSKDFYKDVIEQLRTVQ